MTLQAVTPEELDEWLQTTEVTEEDEAAPDFEPLPVDLPVKQGRPSKKKTSWRRRSSLDEDNIASRPCFGVDAKALLANESQEEMEEEVNHNPYFKRSSDGSSTVVVSNQYPQSPDHGENFMILKKRRVSAPSDARDSTEFNRQSSSYSQVSIDTTQTNTPYFRLVTDDSYKLDHEAQFSRHASQYAVPKHTMDQEARYSRRASQFTVSQNSQGVESFLRAMEVSQRSHKMLLNQQFPASLEDMRRSEAMRECEESRSLLVRLSRRSVVKKMTGGMNSGLNCGYRPTSIVGKTSNLDKIAADLRRMEEMLLAEQATQEQLRNARYEFC
ncbi:hypothetical protein ACHAXN_000604 [Cyclotella atomus]